MTNEHHTTPTTTGTPPADESRQLPPPLMMPDPTVLADPVPVHGTPSTGGSPTARNRYAVVLIAVVLALFGTAGIASQRCGLACQMSPATLEAANERMVEALGRGDGDTVRSMLSNRCSSSVFGSRDFDTVISWYHRWYTNNEVVWSRADIETGRVQYQASRFDRVESEQWILENGSWRWDNCPRNPQ